MADLDTIMSGGGSDPVTEQQPAIEQASPPRDDGRDENGRFAARQPEPAPQPEAQEQRPPDGYIPIQALDARLAKQQEKMERDFQLQMAREREAWQRQMQGFQPQQSAQPAPPPDFFENPDAAVDHRFQSRIRETIDPIQNQIMFNARLVAESVHGKEKFDAAVKAFDEAVALGQADPRDIQRIKSSPNPFHEAVQWHQRNSVLNEVGNDPVAYREKLRKELMAELQQQPAQQAQPAPGAMPQSFTSARSPGQTAAPQFNGPVPLSELMGR